MRLASTLALRLLLVALVPVLVVTGPAEAGASAAAAAALDDTQQVWLGDEAAGAVNHRSPTYAPGTGLKCDMTGYARLNAGGVYSVRARVRCTWGFAVRLEGLRIIANGSGPGCEFKAEVPVPHNTETDSTLINVNMLPGGSGPVPTTDCVLTLGEVTPWHTADQWGGCEDDFRCYGREFGFAWPLGRLEGPPEAEPFVDTGECPYFTLGSRPKITPDYGPSVGAPGSWQGTLQNYWSGRMPEVNWKSIANPGSSSGNGGYGINVIFRVVYRTAGPDSAPFTVDQAAPPFGAWASTSNGDPSWVKPGTTLTESNGNPIGVAGSAAFGNAYPGGRAFRSEQRGATNSQRLYIYGVQVFVVRFGGDPWPSSSDNFNGAPATVGGAGDLFTNSPGRCRFWFGPKYWDDQDPVSRVDEPSYPKTDDSPDGPPVPDETAPDRNEPIADPGSPEDDGAGECAGFSVTDPTSWAGAGICVLVKLITALIDLFGRLLGLVKSLIAAVGRIAEAIAGLVAALLEGLLELLMLLFVPSPSSWDFGSVTDQAQERPPFSVADEASAGAGQMRDAYTSAPDDCGTIADFGDLAGESAALECDQIRGVPGMGAFRTLVAIALWLFTGLGAWKMIGSAVSK